MSHENDIQNFEEWALNLGCPLECLPPKNMLVKVFQSGQSLAFLSLMKRVKPVDEVKHMRDNITVNKMRQVSHKPQLSYSKQSAPEELQRYFAIKKLKDRISETEQRVSDTKAEYTKLMTSVKKMNIEKIQMRERLAELRAKCAIVKSKQAEVRTLAQLETENSANIRNVMPVKIEQANSKESLASEAIAAAVAELQSYYANFTSDYEISARAREKLWEKLRKIFANIPNYVLWNALCKLKDQQTAQIGVMSKMNVAKQLQIDSNAGTDTVSGIKVAMGKMYAQHVSLMTDMHLVKIEKEQLMTDYVAFYNSFIDNLRAKYAMYNNTDIDEDFLAEYVSQWSTSFFNQAQIEYLERSIERNEITIKQNAQQLNDHHLLTNSLRFIYSDIETLYCRMRGEMNALASVKDKIEHNQNFLKYFIQTKNEQQAGKLIGSGLIHNNSSSSFDSSNDNVLSSTQLDNDMDSTVMSFKPEILISRPNAVILPQFLNEFKMFLQVPMPNMKNQLSISNMFELRESIFLRPAIFEQIPESLRELIPGYSLTPMAFLRHAENLKQWHGKQKAHMQMIKICKELPTVDELRLAQMRRQQIDALTELGDEASNIGSNTAFILDDIDRYIKFINENPLRKYIPKHKLFNGQSYQVYETEFMMYYKMINQGGRS